VVLVDIEVEVEVALAMMAIIELKGLLVVVDVVMVELVAFGHDAFYMDNFRILVLVE